MSMKAARIFEERGSATVEAALVMPFILMVIFSFIYATFYFMDKGQLESQVYLSTLDTMEMEKRSLESKTILEQGYKKLVQETLKKEEFIGRVTTGVNKITYSRQVGQDSFGIRFSVKGVGRNLKDFFSVGFHEIQIRLGLHRYKPTDIARCYKAMS